jgi:predicted transcriptional regulator
LIISRVESVTAESGMTIPDKPKSKNQKYKLTAKGRAFVSLKNEDINHGRSEQ